MNDGVLLVGGPTASGKSEIAVDLAMRFDAEIVGADSRQIYAGMPIGTALPPPALLERVPHHLVAFLDPAQRYSAARFASDALEVIRRTSERGRRTIVVGGTGFYLRALAGDVVLSGAYDAGVRARLAREALVHPAPVLHEWLSSIDPVRAAAIEPNDSYRITRALEIALCPDSVQPSEQRSLRQEDLSFVKVWIDTPVPVLDARIERRVDAMLAAGFVAEAERIGGAAVAADAVGYPPALAFLAGLMTAAELRAALIRATRRYAKRQRTWFRAEPGAIAVDGSDTGKAGERIAAIARERLRWTERV